MIPSPFLNFKFLFILFHIHTYAISGNNIDFDSTTLNVTIVAGTNISTVNITLKSDDIVEGDEMFNITLSVPSSLDSRITTGTITSATVIIVDTTGEYYCCNNSAYYSILQEFVLGNVQIILMVY